MSQLTVAASGLSDADIDLIRTELHAIPGRAWTFVDGTRARLLIVDIDTVWGHMEWLRATADGQQVAALSNDKQVRGCDLMLHKPLRGAQLREVLIELAPEAATARADAADTASPAKPASAVHARAPKPTPAPQSTPEPMPVADEPDMLPADPPANAFNEAMPELVHSALPPEPMPELEAEPEPEPEPPVPANMTLGECLLAGHVAAPVTIKGLGGVELSLDPERGGYTGSSTLKPLAPLLERPFAETRALDADAVERMRKAPALPLTRLLWFAALSATPGQLAPQLDPQARYHLARWPQIEREFPRHFRIATAMMKGPGTLGDIASSANAPLSDVVDFVNAYSVAGYVTNDAVAAGESRGSDGNRTRVFSRLRRPFSRGAQDPA